MICIDGSEICIGQTRCLGDHVNWMESWIQENWKAGGLGKLSEEEFANQDCMNSIVDNIIQAGEIWSVRKLNSFSNSISPMSRAAYTMIYRHMVWEHMLWSCWYEALWTPDYSNDSNMFFICVSYAIYIALSSSKKKEIYTALSRQVSGAVNMLWGPLFACLISGPSSRKPSGSCLIKGVR